MTFDVKQQNGNSLQQSFGDVQGHGQGWRQDNGGSGNDNLDGAVARLLKELCWKASLQLVGIGGEDRHFQRVV